MAAAMGLRKTVSIYDYPEHLNPFHEEDNHRKIRFWTLGRKLNRSNSINFSGIKDLKNSWAFRSFMKKGKKGHTPSSESKPQTNGVNGDNSPIVFRRALQYSSTSNAGSRTTIGSPERPERYVYGGSVTPLPRSRFQERLRSPSQQEVNSLRGVSMTPRLARSDAGSQLSVASTNPFDDGAPVPPVRASRRKKKKAPLPPSALAADVTVTSVESESNNDSTIKSTTDPDLELESEIIPLNVELRIVEEDETSSQKNEDAQNGNAVTVTEESTSDKKETSVTQDIDAHKNNVVVTEIDVVTNTSPPAVKAPDDTKEITDDSNKQVETDDLPTVPFPKVDIVTYRRNSSLNEDDFRIRRGNIEDYEVANKRSKSFTSGLNNSFVTYDINLNEDIDEPHKVVCKLYDGTSRKHSLDTSISSTEREFIEIDKATKELEREISKLNSALIEDDNDVVLGARLSVSDIKKRFDNNNFPSTPNPIPKPRRSQYGSNSPINGNY